MRKKILSCGRSEQLRIAAKNKIRRALAARVVFLSQTLSQSHLAINQKMDATTAESLTDLPIQTSIDERTRLTLEAMAGVDAGQYVDDADVEAWIESLDTDKPLPIPTPR